MLLREFYQIIESEESTCNFLRENGLLQHPTTTVNNCHRCGTQMRSSRKRNRGGDFRPVLRCPKKNCQTTQSVRAGNAFFSYTDLNGRLRSNLKLWEIMELVYMFVIEMPIKTTCALTGKSSTTVVEWYNLCREVCTNMMSVSRQEEPIQIDEAQSINILKKMRGKTPEMLHAHLDEHRWRIQNKDAPDKFLKFLEDIATIYC